MSPKYCLPIIKSKKSEVFGLIEENLNKFEFFEVWLDYVDDLNVRFVQELIEKLGPKLIILFRRKNLSKILLSFKIREEILTIIDRSNVWLDLDVVTQEWELGMIKKNDLKIKKILSYHDYDKTPSKKILENIIKTMMEYEANIFKIATYCKTKQDGLNLLEILLQLKKENKKYIILGMGEDGVITRIFGTLWGNEMIFAPLTNDSASAPGQLTKEQLETIFKQLN